MLGRREFRDLLFLYQKRVNAARTIQRWWLKCAQARKCHSQHSQGTSCICSRWSLQVPSRFTKSCLYIYMSILSMATNRWRIDVILLQLLSPPFRGVCFQKNPSEISHFSMTMSKTVVLSIIHFTGYSSTIQISAGMGASQAVYFKPGIVSIRFMPDVSLVFWVQNPVQLIETIELYSSYHVCLGQACNKIIEHFRLSAICVSRHQTCWKTVTKRGRRIPHAA